MVKVVFKNVGQGDSIIIEWKEGSNNKIGIIDCNKYNGTNPVLNYLKSINCKFLEFLILSHPHYDHFSGFQELFEWCLVNDVQVNSFLITCQTIPDYIITALKTATAKSLLAEVFKLARRMRNERNMRIFTIDDNPDYYKPIGDWFMSFISPSSYETDNYIKDIKSFSREEEFHNNPKGNWLSTVIKLKNKDNCVILTSDVEKDTLTRIKREERISDKIVLAQAPHHGSKKNHNKTFWSLSRRLNGAPMAISVGENKYAHPSEKVIDDFRGLQFIVQRTDKSSNEDIYFNSEEYNQITLALDSVSELVEDVSNYSTGNDLEFIL